MRKACGVGCDRFGLDGRQGRCMALVYERASGNRSCRNTPGAGVSSMTISSIP